MQKIILMTLLKICVSFHCSLAATVQVLDFVVILIPLIVYPVGVGVGVGVGGGALKISNENFPITIYR